MFIYNSKSKCNDLVTLGTAVLDVRLQQRKYIGLKAIIFRPTVQLYLERPCASRVKVTNEPIVILPPKHLLSDSEAEISNSLCNSRSPN